MDNQPNHVRKILAMTKRGESSLEPGSMQSVSVLNGDRYAKAVGGIPIKGLRKLD